MKPMHYDDYVRKFDIKPGLRQTDAWTDLMRCAKELAKDADLVFPFLAALSERDHEIMQNYTDPEQALLRDLSRAPELKELCLGIEVRQPGRRGERRKVESIAISRRFWKETPARR